MGLDLPCRLLTRLALIHKGELDVLSGCLLDLLGKLAHLCAFLLIGRSHLQRQQMAQGGHRDVHLAAIAPFAAIAACAAFVFR